MEVVVFQQILQVRRRQFNDMALVNVRQVRLRQLHWSKTCITRLPNTNSLLALDEVVEEGVNVFGRLDRARERVLGVLMRPVDQAQAGQLILLGFAQVEQAASIHQISCMCSVAMQRTACK